VVVVGQHITVIVHCHLVVELEVAVAQLKHTADLDIPVHITEMAWAVDLLLTQAQVAINIIMAETVEIIPVVAEAAPMVMRDPVVLESS
jgi:hypothetical protein